MKKLFTIIFTSMFCLNLYASTYIVELEDQNKNVEKIHVENDSNLIEIINDANNNQIFIKSIRPGFLNQDAAKKGGGEGGVDG